MMTELPTPYVVAPAQSMRGDLLNVFDQFVATIDAAHARIDALESEIAELRRVTAPTLYSAAEVESLLGISSTTRREMTIRGDLPAIYIDRRPKFRRAEVEALIDRKATA